VNTSGIHVARATSRGKSRKEHSFERARRYWQKDGIAEQIFAFLDSVYLITNRLICRGNLEGSASCCALRACCVDTFYEW
jgi:hypothetical protein